MRIPRICFEKRVKLSNGVSHTIHRSLRSALCFSSCMKFSFRGHSCGFTPCTGIHFPSLGLNRAGHDTSFSIGSWSPDIILVLMCSQFVQKWYMLIQVSSLLAISRHDVVHCLSDVSLCQYAWRGSPFCEYGKHGKENGKIR